MTSKEIDQYIGKRVRRERIRAGLTQKDLTAALRWSSSASFSNIEKGLHRITVADLLEISYQLGLRVETFLPDVYR